MRFVEQIARVYIEQPSTAATIVNNLQQLAASFSKNKITIVYCKQIFFESSENWNDLNSFMP